MRAITVAFLLALPLLPVHAQQQNTIILACNGTSKVAVTPLDTPTAELKITDLGIIVNAANRTVTFATSVLPITHLSDTYVGFGTDGKSSPIIGGSIDRVTGHTSIVFWYEKADNNSSLELTCRPATRLF
jgi:hypothetical protein